MNPKEMNIMVASMSNYLYECLPHDDFECLALFLNELSKSMFNMTVFERLCAHDKHRRHHPPHVRVGSEEAAQEE